MTRFAYLLALLVPIACMAVVDRRWRLVLWADRRRALVVIALGVCGFLGWDLVAIGQGYYRRGGSSLMTGVEISAHLPLEEVFFVAFLCYFTLVTHQLAQRLLEDRLAPGPRGGAGRDPAGERVRSP
jgi:lycopene cyclase domain-containing protein